MAEKGQQGVKYEQVGDEYFQKRKLRRYAGVLSLWALGVGAVISGQFSGWNYGLAFGWGSMFAATVVISVMYLGLTYSIAEMATALPHTGGAYSFARSAMGPWGGFITGVAENIEYVLTPAVVVFFIGTYMSAILETPPEFQPVYWMLGYGIFVAANLFGVELSFRVTVFVTLVALACLVFFYIAALPQMDFGRWAMNVGVGPDGALAVLPEGNGPWFPDGIHGVLAALPFAVWLYLAIEQLPLASEESIDPKRDMPSGILFGIFTLMASAFAVLLLNSSISPGSWGLRASGEPLLEGFRTLFGTNWGENSGPGGDRGLGRELPRDHLRVRASDLLAVAGGIFSALLVGDARNAQYAPYCADRGCLGRSRCDAVCLVLLWRGQRRRFYRRRVAEHGRVWRNDFVCASGGVVRHAARPVAQHRAAVSQSVRHGGRGADVDYRAGYDLFPSDGSLVPGAGAWRCDLLCDHDPLFRGVWTDAAGAVPGGRICDVARQGRLQNALMC